MATPRKDDRKRKTAGKEAPGATRGEADGLSAGPFRDILLAPDRDVIPGAWPTLSFSEDDDEDFLVPLRRRMVGRVELRRRGVEHGCLAVFEPLAQHDPGGLPAGLPAGKRRRALEQERWVAARPLMLAGMLARGVAGERNLEPRRLEDLRRRLQRPEELAPWVRSSLKKTKRLSALPSRCALEDPERDLARVEVAGRFGGTLREDLWVKSGRLSLHAPDRSLRVRASFGVEGADDASRDVVGHRMVADLGEALLPGARALARAAEPRQTLERLLGAKVFFTQGIGYWNAPEGGARMHHDAFGDTGEDARGDSSGQRGVAYVQISGQTVWIALSIADLAERVREFLDWLDAGDAPWIVEESLGGAGGLAELVALSRHPGPLQEELAQPGCGALGALVERGAEFTGALIDAGHACLLRPGDGILLPNHGPARTAMHAVFCASPQAGYGLSVAIRCGAEA